MMHVSAHPVYLPEILRNIFEFSTNLLDLALVCKLWSESALPLIWDDIPVRAVFALCSPSQQAGIDRDKLVNESPAIDPIRVSWYTSMVHTLRIPKDSALWKWSRAIARLVDSALPQELFPNLRRIHIFTSILPQDIEIILYFLQEKKITYLELRVYVEPSTKLLEAIGKQLPGLRTLICCYPKRVSESILPSSKATLAGMFRGLPKLRYVSIPKDWAGENVLIVLSQFPHLETLRFTPTPDSSLSRFETLPESLPHGSFPELRILDVVAPFRKAISCLSPTDTIPNLNSFDIESACEPTKQLRLLVEVFASQYPNLSSLQITSFQTNSESSDDDLRRIMDSLRTLTALRDLSIHHSIVLGLDEGQVNALGRPLTQLEVLRLAPTWDSDAPPPRIGIHSLLQFSQSLPKIRVLQLHLNVSALEFPSVEREQKFRYLEQLEVGGSTAMSNSAAMALATFVDELVPDGSFLYYKNYPNDPLHIKIFSAVVWILELAGMIVASHLLYATAIEPYREVPALMFIDPPYQVLATILLTNWSGCVVQFYFIDRVRRFTKLIWPAIICVALVLWTFAGVIILVVIGKNGGLLEYTLNWKWVSTSGLVVAAAVDIFLAAMLCWNLASQRKSLFKRSTNLIDKIISMTITTGLLTWYHPYFFHLRSGVDDRAMDSFRLASHSDQSGTHNTPPGTHQDKATYLGRFKIDLNSTPVTEVAVTTTTEVEERFHDEIKSRRNNMV
ncbi:hypothetical protein ONZ45_g5085 [Pleurotus djamor]|nr:hypothetical protein ONZ45_g5085 [Pleurotus djamor]